MATFRVWGLLLSIGTACGPSQPATSTNTNTGTAPRHNTNTNTNTNTGTGTGTGTGTTTTAGTAPDVWGSDRLSCGSDAECVYVIHTPMTACCDRTGETAVNAAWYQRLGTWRQSGCATAQCPAMEPPSAAWHGPNAPECRAVCRERSCAFVCDQPPGVPAIIPP